MLLLRGVRAIGQRVRNVAGHALEGTAKLAIGGTGLVLKAGLGDETSEAIATMLKERGEDVWSGQYCWTSLFQMNHCKKSSIGYSIFWHRN